MERLEYKIEDILAHRRRGLCVLGSRALRLSIRKRIFLIKPIAGAKG